ncbi:MAG: sigma-70 family RNA polymerase sigma factor [Acidiferrobacterales bacterium]
MKLGTITNTDQGPLESKLDTQPHRDVFVSHVEGSIDRLYSTALRLTRNPSDAEELVAETVAKAWACLNTLQDPERCLPWMLRIMTNMFISEKRTARSKTPHEEYLEEPGAESNKFSLFERLHQPFLLWWGNPEQEFLDNVVKNDIEWALNELPENFCIVVVLSDVEGLTYQEIAEALDVPIGTVRSRLARARSLLQKALWDHALDKGLVDGPPQE